eukprot:264863-Prymnesium_polylepis.2
MHHPLRNVDMYASRIPHPNQAAAGPVLGMKGAHRATVIGLFGWFAFCSACSLYAHRVDKVARLVAL